MVISRNTMTNKTSAEPTQPCLAQRDQPPGGIVTRGLWQYIEHPDAREAWFDRDCQLHAEIVAAFGDHQQQGAATASPSQGLALVAGQRARSRRLRQQACLSPCHITYRVLMQPENALPMSVEAIVEDAVRRGWLSTDQAADVRQRTKAFLHAQEGLLFRGGQSKGKAPGTTARRPTDDDWRAWLRATRQSMFAGLHHRYYLQHRRTAALSACLVNTEYQSLGMTVFPRPHDLPYIPAEVEHRFLEVLPSTLGAAVGLGLFLRTNRMLRAGCVFAEYRGHQLTREPRGIEQRYTVRCRGGDDTADGGGGSASSLYICGLVEGSDMLECHSFAPFANDAGVEGANAELRVFPDALPGRAFLMAVRNIHAGDEVFVAYGAGYWNRASYTDIATARKRHQPMAAAEAADGLSSSGGAAHWTKCRSCGAVGVLKRARKQHLLACLDPLTSTQIQEIDPLPVNEFTRFQVASSSTTKARQEDRIGRSKLVPTTRKRSRGAKDDTADSTHASSSGDDGDDGCAVPPKGDRRINRAAARAVCFLDDSYDEHHQHGVRPSSSISLAGEVRQRLQLSHADLDGTLGGVR